MTEQSFATLGLAEPLMQALAASGYTTPTPIQAQAIPPLLAGKDLLGLAETGTGKTAAFALPILQALSKIHEPVAPRTCRALILAPTRELAIQIGDSFATYGANLHLRHTVIFGGVGARPQVRAMDRGVDVLIATPGRLLDLMSTGNVKLNKVTYFVLDEADRMLDMGFIRDVKRIVKEVPKVRQSLLFSATMPQDITSLANEILHNPVRVEISRVGKTVDRTEQFVHFVDTKSKRAALAALLKDPALSRVIVFARTKHGADRVARGLAASGIGAFAIHGNKSQNARQAALESFRTGKARVLVATDIAARGIDIDDISHVINYDIPNIPESYVHRIGRTARAGNAGIAIALCAPEERAFLRDIERLTRKPLTQGPAIPGMAEVAASLPPIPTKSADRDDNQNFERGRGRVTGRRHMPHTRPATAWHEGDPARPVEAAAPRGAGRNSEQRGAGRDSDRRGPPRGEGRNFEPRPERRDARPINRDDRPRTDAPRGDRPREDRPWSNKPNDGPRRGERARSDRPLGDRARADAPRGDRSDRPHGARPFQGRADGERRGPPRGEGRNFDQRGEGRNVDNRGDRPRSDAPRSDRPRDPERAVAGGKPWEQRTPRSDDRSPAQGRSEGRRPDTRSPDAQRPPNRWNTSNSNRGGDRPRSAAPRVKSE